MGEKKVVYIAGPIKGVENYWEPFERAEDELIGLGYIPLSPAHLPEGMNHAQYMRICFAMIDSADAVVLLPGWGSSYGARLEHDYCKYTGKPAVMLRDRDPIDLGVLPQETTYTWLRLDLEEVLGK